jgi:hypothetical protein
MHRKYKYKKILLLFYFLIYHIHCSKYVLQFFFNFLLRIILCSHAISMKKRYMLLCALHINHEYLCTLYALIYEFQHRNYLAFSLVRQIYVSHYHYRLCLGIYYHDINASSSSSFNLFHSKNVSYA